MKIGEIYINKVSQTLTSGNIILYPHKIKLMYYKGSDRWQVKAWYKFIGEELTRDNVIMLGKQIYRYYKKA